MSTVEVRGEGTPQPRGTTAQEYHGYGDRPGLAYDTGGGHHGMETSNILKGIHLSMAGRLTKLLKSIGGTGGVVLVTGGLALDAGLIAALQEDLAGMKDLKTEVRSHADSTYAGALGSRRCGARTASRYCSRAAKFPG